MKLLSRTLSLIIISAFLITSVVGCQSSQSTEPKDKKVTLRFSWWGGEDRQKATLDAIRLYMDKNPNIIIEPEYSSYDGYQQKLITQLTGEVAPDIMQVDYLWINDLVKQGDVFTDLNTLKSTIDISGFSQTLLDSYCIKEGKLIGLPTGIGAQGLIYNKNFLKSFDIPEDTVWNWNKILDIGKEVHKKDSSKYLLTTLQGSYIESFMIPYLQQKTGQSWVKDDYTLGFNKAQLTDAFSYIRKLVDNGVIQSFEEGAAFVGADVNPAWVNENLGLMIVWSSAIPLYTNDGKIDIGVSKYPVPEDSVDNAISVVPAQIISLNKKSQNMAEAAKFLNWFLNSSDAVKVLKDARGLQPVEASRVILKDAGLLNQSVIDSTQIAIDNDNGKVPSALSFNEELWQIGEDYVDKVGYKKITPEVAATEMIQRFEKKLKEIKDSAQ